MTTEQCFVIPEQAQPAQATSAAASTAQAVPAPSATPAVPAAKSSALPDRRTLAAFGLFILLGGGASVAIRITYAELPPLWAAASRFFLAGLVFWAIMFFRKIPVPRGQALIGAALFGTLAVGVFLR